MGSLGQDLRYGVRTLRKSPAFTATAALALALGIGANTVIFSVVNALLLRPLPFSDPARLVAVFNRFPELDRGPASFADFEDWRRETRQLAGVAAIRTTNLNLRGRGEPQRLRGAFVSRGALSLLGLRPLAGRAFLAAEHLPGAAGVALVSRRLAQQQLGGVAAAAGRVLTLDDRPYTVVGVIPPNLPSVVDWADADVLLPLEANPPFKRRGTNYLSVVARLRSATTLARARDEMTRIQNGINARFPDNKHEVVVVPLADTLFGAIRPSLLLLLAAVGFVLLIACANVAGLVLIRAHGRARELAVRAGLGARRSRMIQQVLTESLLLALLGGVAGVLLALAGTRLLVASWPADLPSPGEPGAATSLTADWRVLCFTLLIAAAAGILCGLAPALRASRIDFNEALKAGARGAGGAAGRRRARGFFVVGEIALATLLLVGAGLMLRSLALLQGVDPGFRPERLLIMAINLPSPRYAADSRQAAFWTQLMARIGVLPGVLAAGAVTDLPLGGGSTTGDLTIAGRPPWPMGQGPIVQKEVATPGYLEALGVSLWKGRLFDGRDRAGAPKVAIVSREAARRFWPREDPLGKRIDLGFGSPGDWQQIVGVVGDVKAESLSAAPIAQIYLCAHQYPARMMAVVVRAATDPARLAPAVRRQVFAVDPGQPVYQVQTMETLLAKTISGRRMASWLLGLFACLATLLAGLGIYSTTAYAVGQRTHEIGVRMALGAERRQVLRLVLAEGGAAAALGLALGLAAALALTRLLGRMLYGVRPTDAATFAAVALGFAAVALAANYIPASRAARIDPLRALRSD